MKHPLPIVLLSILVLLAACQGAQDSAPTPLPTSEDETFPRVTVTPLPAPADSTQGVVPEGYPAPPSPIPTPQGYPGPPTPLPTLDPYPAGGYIWAIRPVGQQCAEPGEEDFADLQEAVTALTAAGVTIRSSGLVELIVCAACGCPTSTHYRVEVESSSFAKAEMLGWMREQ